MKLPDLTQIAATGSYQSSYQSSDSHPKCLRSRLGTEVGWVSNIPSGDVIAIEHDHRNSGFSH